jgi:hypothetical protein
LYRTPQLPPVPAAFGHYDLINDWGMLANDRVGDCTCAGADHEVMLWTIEGFGRAATFNDFNTLADYSAITGYNPNNPNTDQGAVVRDVLRYRQKTGMVDSLGKRHKIGAYLMIDPSNLNEVLESMYLFSAVGIGFAVPQSAIDQFEAGLPWSTVKDSPVVGGHYVPGVGYDGTYIYCVTWGKVQKMEVPFFKKYCEEAWAILSQEFLNANNLSPEGFNIDQLKNDLLAIPSMPKPSKPSPRPRHK